jgi:hypothetical protein
MGCMMARYKVVKLADVTVMKTVTTVKSRVEQKEGAHGTQTQHLRCSKAFNFVGLFNFFLLTSSAT